MNLPWHLTQGTHFGYFRELSKHFGMSSLYDILAHLNGEPEGPEEENILKEMAENMERRMGLQSAIEQGRHRYKESRSRRHVEQQAAYRVVEREEYELRQRKEEEAIAERRRELETVQFEELLDLNAASSAQPAQAVSSAPPAQALGTMAPQPAPIWKAPPPVSDETRQRMLRSSASGSAGPATNWPPPAPAAPNTEAVRPQPIPQYTEAPSLYDGTPKPHGTVSGRAATRREGEHHLGNRYRVTGTCTWYWKAMKEFARRHPGRGHLQEASDSEKVEGGVELRVPAFYEKPEYQIAGMRWVQYPGTIYSRKGHKGYEALGGVLPIRLSDGKFDVVEFNKTPFNAVVVEGIPGSIGNDVLLREFTRYGKITAFSRPWYVEEWEWKSNKKVKRRVQRDAGNRDRTRYENFCFIGYETPGDALVAVYTAHGKFFHSMDIQVTIMDRYRACIDANAPGTYVEEAVWTQGYHSMPSAAHVVDLYEDWNECMATVA